MLKTTMKKYELRLIFKRLKTILTVIDNQRRRKQEMFQINVNLTKTRSFL